MKLNIDQRRVGLWSKKRGLEYANTPAIGKQEPAALTNKKQQIYQMQPKT
jgi:hypothetical protein